MIISTLRVGPVGPLFLFWYMGSSTTLGFTSRRMRTVSGEAFYYISQKGEKPVAFMPQRVVDQRVIAIYFDKNRRVQRLANYGLQDGKIFDFISRTTPTSGQELSYLTPLFKLLSFN